MAQRIDAVERHAEDTAHVLDRGPGRHRAEGGDLGNALFAVLLLDVLDDLFAAVLAEVDVDIGRLGAVGIEEALEEQVVLERIDVADA